MKVNKIKLSGIVLIMTMLIMSGIGVTTASAQSYQEDPITWGVKGGTTLTDFNGDAISDSEMLTGFTGGLFFNYRFSKYLAVQPEVNFSEMGAELDNRLIGNKGSAKVDIGYINVPVLAKFYIPNNSMVTPTIFAGPRVGFMLYGDAGNMEIDDQLKDVTFGLTFGVGADFNVASSPRDFIRTVGIDVRYNLGLTDVYDLPNNPEVKNSGFLGTLSIGF